MSNQDATAAASSELSSSPNVDGRPWPSWTREFLALVDVRDADRLREHFADDVRLVFGNDHPIEGRDAVVEAFRSTYAGFAKIRHDIETVARGETNGSDVFIAEAVANYWKESGAHAALPVVSTFRVDDAGRVREYRIYMDREPLGDLK